MYWNQAEFPSQEKKVMFVISYMRGPAYSYLVDRVNDYLSDPDECVDRQLFNNYRLFLRNLTMVYGDVDEKRISERQLKQTR
jgi:hypothetical protein